MRITLFLLAALAAAASFSTARTPASGAPGTAQADSLARSRMIEDSLKMERLFAVAQYPLIRGGKWSGVIPVENPTEVPDPTHEYKLLFELIAKNPDSLAKEINFSLDEVARVLNLHIASGIPLGKITPVVVIHGPGIEAVVTNESYRKRHAMDNPNLKIVRDIEAAGAKVIVCGQAMAFFGVAKEELLPEIRITLTAQTVLSNYQSKGFILYRIVPDR